MTHLTLYLGDSEADSTAKDLLEAWSEQMPTISLECHSIHADPVVAVRLGITQLPALVQEDEIIVQGAPQAWVLPLLNRVFAQPD